MRPCNWFDLSGRFPLLLDKDCNSTHMYIDVYQNKLVKNGCGLSSLTDCHPLVRVLISALPTNWMVNASQSRQSGFGTSCCTFGCNLLKHWRFSTVYVPRKIISYFSYFSGTMLRNLLAQILVCIIRLFSEGYSLEVARMLAKSQGCVRKILLRKRYNVQPIAREDKPLIPMVRDIFFISAPWLSLEMILRLRRTLTLQSIVNSLVASAYRSMRPARCPIDFGSQATPPCVRENTQMVGHWALEALYP